MRNHCAFKSVILTDTGPGNFFAMNLISGHCDQIWPIYELRGPNWSHCTAYGCCRIYPRRAGLALAVAERAPASIPGLQISFRRFRLCIPPYLFFMFLSFACRRRHRERERDVVLTMSRLCFMLPQLEGGKENVLSPPSLPPSSNSRVTFCQYFLSFF